MTTPRFAIPTAPVPAAGPAFAMLPAAVGCWMAPAQVAVTQQLYQIAWERTQAALTPTAVERLYRVSVN